MEIIHCSVQVGEMTVVTDDVIRMRKASFAIGLRLENVLYLFACVLVSRHSSLNL